MATQAADAAAADGIKERLKDFCLHSEDSGKRLIVNALGPELKTDAWTAIGNLQNSLSLGYPSANAALQFLSCLSVSSLEAHLSLFESLKEKIEMVIMRMNDEQLKLLLRETILLLNFKEMRSIPLAIVKRLNDIPPPFIKILIDKNLVHELPFSVRRQAWEQNTTSFHEALRDPRLRLAGGSYGHDTVRSLSEMIGKSEQLFRSFAQFLISSGILGLGEAGTLLVKVVFVLQEMGNTMPSYERLHDLASITSRCVETGKIDDPTVTSLYSMLRGFIISQASADQRQQAKAAGASVAAGSGAKVSQKGLLNAWNVLFREDVGQIFHRPVTDAIAPGYSKVIAKPMDLSLVKRKIQGGKYDTIEDFESDVQLMVNNCRQYNGPASPYTLVGEKLLSKLQQIRGNILRTADVPAAERDTSKPLLKPIKAETAPAPSAPPVVAAPRVSLPAPTPAAPPSAPPAAPKPEDKQALLKTLANAWKFVNRLDVNNIFKSPVTVPGYRKIISHPIDLETMMEKCKKGAYRSLDDFDKDLQLMFNNCRKFNGPDSPFTQAGDAIYKEWKEYKRSQDALATTAAPIAAPAPAPAPAPTPAPAPAPAQASGFLVGSDVMQDACQYVWDLDLLDLFHEPVQLEGYNKIVKRPMDLSTMRKKLSQRRYGGPEDLDADMRLMWDNCMLFNEEDVIICTYTNILSTQWTRLFKDLVAHKPGVPTAQLFSHSLNKGDASKLAQLLTHAHSPDLISRCLELLTNMDSDRLFAEVPTDRIAPNYSAIIQNKVALSTMRKRKYAQLSDFHADVRQMISNCINYNYITSPFSKTAMTLWSKWLIFFHSLQRRQQQPAQSAQPQPTAAAAARSTPAIPKRARVEDREEASGQEKKAAGAASLNLTMPASSSSSSHTPDNKRPRHDAPAPTSEADTEENEDQRKASAAMALAAQGLYVPGQPIIVHSDIPSTSTLQRTTSGSSPTLYTVLRACWEYLSAQDQEAYFKNPVTDPVYLAIVERPVDLATMLVKIDRKMYSSLDKFRDEVLLMARNHLAFYPADSANAKAAQRLAFVWSLVQQNARLALSLDAEGKEAVVPVANRPPSAEPVAADPPTQPAEAEAEAEAKATAASPARASTSKEEGEEAMDTSEPAPASSTASIQAPSATPAATLSNSPKQLQPAAGTEQAKEGVHSDAASDSRQLQFAAGTVRGLSSSVQDLPAVHAEGSIQFTLLMLRDARLQRLLVKLLARLMQDLVRTQQTAPPSLEAQDRPVKLPYEDAEIRFVVQLCQLAFTKGVSLQEVNELVIRCYLPSILLRPSSATVAACLPAYPLPEQSAFDAVALTSFLESFAAACSEHSR